MYSDLQFQEQWILYTQSPFIHTALHGRNYNMVYFIHTHIMQNNGYSISEDLCAITKKVY